MSNSTDQPDRMPLSFAQNEASKLLDRDAAMYRSMASANLVARSMQASVGNLHAPVEQIVDRDALVAHRRGVTLIQRTFDSSVVHLPHRAAVLPISNAESGNSSRRRWGGPLAMAACMGMAFFSGLAMLRSVGGGSATPESIVTAIAIGTEVGFDDDSSFELASTGSGDDLAFTDIDSHAIEQELDAIVIALRTR